MAETMVAARERVGSRRALLLHDGISFAVLLLVSGVLFGLTLFLFRSFEDHRDALARRWSARGAAALREGRPGQAIVPLRAAISYAPDDARYQMLLAEALAATGKTDEATNYFLNLWDARPADSEINLQLARLERARGDVGQAAEYYRAAIFGIWPDHALEQRRAVRYELASYLAQHGDAAGARAEILTAVAAAPDTVPLDLELGRQLEALGDEQDAFGLYRKALSRAPRDGEVLAAAGQAAYGLGNYPEAMRLLRRAREAKTHGAMTAEQMGEMVQDADRMVALSLSRDLPADVRAQHLLAAMLIAKARLDGCVAGEGTPAQASAGKRPLPAAVAVQVPSRIAVGVPATAAAAAAGVSATGTAAAGTAARGAAAAGVPMGGTPAGAAPTGGDLATLEARWKASETPAARRALESDATAQDAMEELIYATERLTAEQCGAPAGDDARLLTMAEAAGSEAQH